MRSASLNAAVAHEVLEPTLSPELPRKRRHGESSGANDVELWERDITEENWILKLEIERLKQEARAKDHTIEALSSIIRSKIGS